MYHEISIANFRSIADLRVDKLCRLNLVVGKNNSGKTSLLEALFLLGGGPDARNLNTLGQLRGQAFDPASMDAVWRPLFYHMHPEKKVLLQGSWQGKQPLRSLEISIPSASDSGKTATTPPPRAYALQSA